MPAGGHNNDRGQRGLKMQQQVVAERSSEDHCFDQRIRRPLVWLAVATLLAAGVFAAVAPTLRWLEFSNGAEGLNVGTAMEIRREGNWLVPTLQGQTRLAKPPLTAWITALAITDQTMRQISSRDASQRERGFVRLAWQTRWPALLAGCGMLLATGMLGRLLAGPDCGLLAILAAATSLLFLRYCRYATTDIQLACWVALTNAMFVLAMLSTRPGHRWLGCIAGGAALGLAMLSKGPVSLIQSIVPLWLWLLLARFVPLMARPGDETDASELHHRPAPAFPGVGATFASIATCLLIALPWFILILIREPDALELWYREVTRKGATDARPDPWYSYVFMLAYVLPWTILFVVGAVVSLQRRTWRLLLPLLLLIVPILIMSLAKDRTERYLLPMLPAAAVTIGIGAEHMLRAWKQPTFVDRLVGFGHWVLVGAMAIGFPIAAATLLDPPWYSLAVALGAAVIGAGVVGMGAMLQRRVPAWVLLSTCCVMLGLQALYIHGYRNTRSGRAEVRPLAQAILEHCPDAVVYNAHPQGKRPPPEIGIYLNRTIRLIQNVAAIEPGGSRPVVVLTRQNPDEPEPVLPPPWQPLARSRRDKAWWWAFVMQAPDAEQAVPQAAGGGNP
ncbi:ArnT family glycosyltransferase [Fontivita pretiosa]|uniref:ArnT family glycosyltransferase n=1 Tax=Fontivita pretiosa TaxID=2989684 RepID=UPI003D163D6A